MEKKRFNRILCPTGVQTKALPSKTSVLFFWSQLTNVPLTMRPDVNVISKCMDHWPALRSARTGCV